MVGMGKVLLIALFVLAVVLVWKAFGPGTWKRNQVSPNQPVREIKGPDDDEEFLWNLEKERFKERRAKEAERAKREEEARRQEKRNRPQKNPEDEN